MKWDWNILHVKRVRERREGPFCVKVTEKTFGKWNMRMLTLKKSYTIIYVAIYNNIICITPLSYLSCHCQRKSCPNKWEVTRKLFELNQTQHMKPNPKLAFFSVSVATHWHTATDLAAASTVSSMTMRPLPNAYMVALQYAPIPKKRSWGKKGLILCVYVSVCVAINM